MPHLSLSKLFFILPIAALFSACSPAVSLPAPEVLQTTPTPFQVAAVTEAIAQTPDTSVTPYPYADLTIESLAARTYGNGQIIDLGQMSQATTFTRHLISYPSDGLTINGFMDIPNDTGPFPVILLLHGYVDPVGYQIETYTARYSASFANAGYIVIHPNYRNYPPSDFGTNDFRVGFAIDVLNLVADVNAQAGQPGLLGQANPDALFLWGHSMGGGIALRVITVGADIQGAVFYSAMSGDERRNFEWIRDVLSDGERGNQELTAPEDILNTISPINYLDRISVPVSIHHGDIDETVPPAWSDELCALLQSKGKSVECFSYHNMPHTFYGSLDDLLIQRSVEFFQRYTPLQ
jgi:dipeptidyl aminopeptidase/acylaminoacyl peptidase